ncbi:DUF397 domain-containing protein [Lentzea flava]|uniref:DUF397 domain-containing protein n=1 Tax=Lentzea flava TaxID=103732 RepID=A0ABQ2UG43_9PSEU|nr:DUF397 domain-containing protein [Lentzea flava]MCP2198551.1 protein of unknown function (DUF397) [Lentzea flava]GGU26656.1 DUF397 domain-containing protein [Lentzea flava]
MTTAWRKSSRSSNGTSCVEVAFAGDDVATRDSKNPTGPMLRFTARSWTGFLNEAKTNRLSR